MTHAGFDADRLPNGRRALAASNAVTGVNGSTGRRVGYAVAVALFLRDEVRLAAIDHQKELREVLRTPVSGGGQIIPHP